MLALRERGKRDAPTSDRLAYRPSSAFCRLSVGTSSTPVLAIAVPFKLEDGAPASPPSYLTTTDASKPAIVLAATFSQTSPAAVEALAWALAQGFTVNIDCQSDLTQESGWDALEDFLTKATASPDLKGKIVLCECSVRPYGELCPGSCDARRNLLGESRCERVSMEIATQPVARCMCRACAFAVPCGIGHVVTLASGG